ncbi:unnamed protein product, partial [Rotaria sordida]
NIEFIDQIYSSSTVHKTTKTIPEIYGGVDINKRKRVGAFSGTDCHLPYKVSRTNEGTSDFINANLNNNRNKGINQLDSVNARELDLTDNIYNDDLGYENATKTQTTTVMSSSTRGLSDDANDAYSGLHNLKSTPNLRLSIMSSHEHNLTSDVSGVDSGFISLKDAPNLETTIMSSCRPSLIDGADSAYSDSNNLKSAPNHHSYTFNAFGDIVNPNGKEKGNQ